MTPLLCAQQQLWERLAATFSWSFVLPPGSSSVMVAGRAAQRSPRRSRGGSVCLLPL